MAYVKAEVVAEHLGVTRRTVWKWAREGIIPSYRLGRERRFVLDEIMEATKKEKLTPEDTDVQM